MSNINSNKKNKEEKENKVILIITVILWIIIILCDIFIKNFSFIEGLKKGDNGLPVLVALLLGPFTIKSLFYLFELLGGKLVKRYDDKDLNFDIKLFRDDLKKINPSYVYFIINFDIDLKRVISAEILKLVKEGYIKCENNKYYKTDKNISMLSETQKLVYEYAVNDKKINEKKYIKNVEKEMKLKGYINNFDRKQLMDKAFKTGIISIFSLPFVVLLIILPIMAVSEAINSTILHFIGSLFGFLVVAFMIFAFFIFPIVAGIYDENNSKYKRTDKGKDLLHKSLGLKKFLKEFSNIEDKKIEELDIREYYLIYSLIFGLNDDEVNRILNNENV